MAENLATRITAAAMRLEDGDPRERFKAVNALATIGRELPLTDRARIVDPLGKVVSDKEPFVRWGVANALGELAHENGLTYLGGLLEDEHANVRFRVAQALGATGSEKGMPLLERLASDTYDIGGHYVVRAYAAVALGMIPHERSVQVLAKLVEDKDPVVRWHVAVALGNIGLASGVEYLAKLINDPVPFVRAHTAIAFAQIGHPDGLPYLETLSKDSMPRVAGISGAALQTLKAITAG